MWSACPWARYCGNSIALSEDVLSAAADCESESLRALLELTEREAVVTVLVRNGTHVATAAEDLGIQASTLYREAKTFGLRDS